jgi:hypothetical protein
MQSVAVKLTAFLDSFQSAYQEWSDNGVINSSAFSLDRIYGDLSDVLVNLLEMIDRCDMFMYTD